MHRPSAALRARIENAAEAIGRLWPLQTFNSANPLAGFEDQPFDDALADAQALFGGRGYPRASVFRNAWERGAIDPDILREHLSEHGFQDDPEALLDRMAADNANAAPPDADPVEDALNQTLTRWLAAFLDQGQAVWPMPNREDGFYRAWRSVAPHDSAVPAIQKAADLPETTADALDAVLNGHPEATWEALFRHHFAALPGWVGFIKWRAGQSENAWQSDYPITLSDYLAVRLTLAQHLGASVAPPADAQHDADALPLAALWLRAWEASEHTDVIQRIRDAAPPASNEPLAQPAEPADTERPAAQLVFCIDVRSEVIRRHLEAVGPYETFGYAGFFGIPMQHERHDGVRVKACPPIVDPKHRIADRPAAHRQDTAERYDAWTRWIASGRKIVKALKTNVAAAFGFVEGSGGFFGGALAARTLLPASIARLHDAWTDRVATPDDFCAPTVDRQEDDAPGLPVGLSHEAQVLYAESAFRLMGWTDSFAPIVVFTGHGSQTPNNPYKSSLDCGACAANPGGPNARVLATICNRPAVRDTLRERGLPIPDDTVFLAGEHNTTTDAIRLFPDTVEADALPDDALSDDALQALRTDLAKAQARAADERIQTMNAAAGVSGHRDVRRRAADWAETRPEWGLAGNLGFVIGSRRLTESTSLDGRCFLHSYDWRTDDDGTALATIMTGPLVVGEWINMQYYFSTVDNAVYGSGSKITQNVVGTVGIVQGNGGDLMTGLPLQSLHTSDTEAYHRPLRLMALIHAPIARVDRILRDNRGLRQLFDHEWLALTVMDPTDGNACLRYQPGGDWTTALPDGAPASIPAGDGVADMDVAADVSDMNVSDATVAA